ncbi:MAG: nucleotide exchange factor GrpE [Candidatus Bipolaricaulota bacterium]|nr:nucleotide exchange factor GrpE [Candidatus Bipolaricaulota bacterium]
MKEENKPDFDSVKELVSNVEELEAKGVLLAQPNDEKLLELMRDLRRELNSYEQDSSSERERILNRLTPVIKKLEELLSGEHLESLANRINEIESSLADLKEGNDKLQQLLEERASLVEGLREESRNLREEFVFEEKIEPGVQELIKLRDNVSAQIKDTDKGSNQMFLEALEGKLLDALRSFDVVEVNTEGNNYDPSRQEVVEKTEVFNQRKDGKVLEVLRTGYRRNDQLIRPQKVRIGDYRGGESQ